MWKIDKKHKNLLNELFEDFKGLEDFKILDAGSGRTSLCFLATRFPKSDILAIIYPGDKRKKEGIKKSVKLKDFQLKEIDIQRFQPKQNEKFDIVLAHLLLGEATKFANNTFKRILSALVKIKTDYLIIVDCIDDPDVDYRLILKHIAKKGEVQKIIFLDKYIGLLIKVLKTRD